MTEYGKWAEQLTFDGEVFGADIVDAQYARCAGFDKIYAVNGLPQNYTDDLMRMAQVSDVPHSWRVKECKSLDEVTPEILALGREELARDRADYHANVITYFGEKAGNRLTFLAAGAVRDKLSRDFENKAFPVFSRIIVAPVQRNKGLGGLAVDHLIKILLNNYYGVKPKAIHFGTESEKILHSVEKTEREEDIKFVYIGDEILSTRDGDHTMHDFLCFTPWFQQEITAACGSLESHANSALLDRFKRDLVRFMQYGVKAVSGDNLEKLFNDLRNSAKATAPADALASLADVFTVRNKIGARDPR